MIEVVAYDPEWPRTFERLRSLYDETMTRAGVPVVAIEHVGSTSVPGLAAKPVIDVDIIVSGDQVEAAHAALVALGFGPLGELGIPQRWAFEEPQGLPRTNTYVIVDGCLSLRNHLTVRDTLRSRADLRDEYGSVKKQVALTATDIEEYGWGKNAVVQQILEEGGIPAAQRAEIDSAQTPTDGTTAATRTKGEFGTARTRARRILGC